MIEELERYYECLKADLEVEIDLHGGRTQMANDLRRLILKTEKELSALKSALPAWAVDFNPERTLSEALYGTLPVSNPSQGRVTT
jgi:hypothetical protein